MIDEIKLIISNYLNNRKPAKILQGTYEGEQIRISENLALPMELIDGNLKEYLQTGDRVRLLRDDGGQRFYLLEICGVIPVPGGEI